MSSGASHQPPSDPFQVAGHAVIVTGGTGGVGRGIAEAFLAAGADVLVCARKEPAEPPTGGGRSAAFARADVRDPDQVAAVVATALERFGRLDVLVNNAGGSPPADSAAASPRFSTAIVTLNLLAPLWFAQHAYTAMTGNEGGGGGGSIINIGSVSGMRPTPNTAAYGAAKAGLVNLTQTLAVEWAPLVRVNSVTVGLAQTEKSHLFYGNDETTAAVAATIPLGRLATPADVASACLFLSSPFASYVSGANLLLHGGGERPAYLGAHDGPPAREGGG